MTTKELYPARKGDLYRIGEEVDSRGVAIGNIETSDLPDYVARILTEVDCTTVSEKAYLYFDREGATYVALNTDGEGYYGKPYVIDGVEYGLFEGCYPDSVSRPLPDTLENRAKIEAERGNKN